MNFKKILTKNFLFNAIAVAAPIVAGVVSGGVFTLPVLVTSLGSLAAKLAPSLADDVLSAKKSRQDKKDSRGQVADDEDPR